MGARFTAPADRGAGRTNGRYLLTAAEGEMALEERLAAISDRVRRTQAFAEQLRARPITPADLQRLEAMLERIDDEVVELIIEVDHTHLLPDPVPAAYARPTALREEVG